MCPECGSDNIYYANTACASCGWHDKGQTVLHANYAPDPDCRWCTSGGILDGHE